MAKGKPSKGTPADRRLARNRPSRGQGSQGGRMPARPRKRGSK